MCEILEQQTGKSNPGTSNTKESTLSTVYVYFFIYLYFILQRKGVVLIYVAFNRNQRHGCILLCKVKHIRNNNKVHQWHLQCFSKRTFFFINCMSGDLESRPRYTMIVFLCTVYSKGLFDNRKRSYNYLKSFEMSQSN